MRNAQAPRHRPHEVEEATGALTLTRKCFRHLALDYVLQVSGWARGAGPGVGAGALGPCGLTAGVWSAGGISGLREPWMSGGGQAKAQVWGWAGTSPRLQAGGPWSRGENPWLCPGRDPAHWRRALGGRRGPCRGRETGCGRGDSAAEAGRGLPPAQHATLLPLPRQINVLQAKKKFEILDSVSAGGGGWAGRQAGAALESGCGGLTGAPARRCCPSCTPSTASSGRATACCTSWTPTCRSWRPRWAGGRGGGAGRVPRGRPPFPP